MCPLTWVSAVSHCCLHQSIHLLIITTFSVLEWFLPNDIVSQSSSLLLPCPPRGLAQTGKQRLFSFSVFTLPQICLFFFPFHCRCMDKQQSCFRRSLLCSSYWWLWTVSLLFSLFFKLHSTLYPSPMVDLIVEGFLIFFFTVSGFFGQTFPFPAFKEDVIGI